MTGHSGATPDASGVTLLVDGAGLILATDGGIAGMFGHEASGLVGRNLFESVAPAMRVPAFLGRFLQGVRSGTLGARFPFMLGAERGALQLSVDLQNGTAPGTYSVGLTVERRLDPSRQREAMLAVDQRARAQPVDALVCEREPIHVPGTIQAQGALLAINDTALTVSVASENLGEMLGIPVAEALGRRLDDLLPPAIMARIRREQENEDGLALPVRFSAEMGEPARPFSFVLHRRDGRVLIEFEAAPSRPEDFDVPSHSATRAIVKALRDARDLPYVVRAAAEHLRRLTGFERLLVYRFDDEWNGEAVAESIGPGWDDSLLGLRFPASDIPRQARELYRHAPMRFVVDRDAAPVPLRATPVENGTIDLSAAVFRSLSPIHLEYQRNLGVNGSMSAAIMTGDRLWGLVIGHHRRPHYVAPETRDAVAIVTDALALRIHDLETAALVGVRNAYRSAEQHLLEAMAVSDDFVDALTNGRHPLTALFGAGGAAVVTGDTATTVGAAPMPAEVSALTAHIRNATANGSFFATDHLLALHPAADSYRKVASGVLAAFIDAERRNVILWFRPEVASTVVWSGDPNKPVLADVASAAVLPRRSFERWVEERRGFSVPWAEWELEIGVSLARAVGGVALRQSRRVHDLSRKQDELLAALEQKDQLIAQKDLLTREIDHRVKNSLQIVSAFLTMQRRHIKDPAAQAAFQETSGRVMSIARVHDSLYQSDDLQQVDLGQTIENLCRDLAGMEGQQRELELKAETGLMVPYRKAVALCLIATELVTNAWKYAYPDKPTGFVEVRVARLEEEGVQLQVRDQGAGLPEDWESRPRSGLGMQLIRAMLKQIDATMQVETDGGACFTVTC